MIWCLSEAHGAGPLVSQPATVSSAALGWGIVSGVTTVIGGIAVGLTNQMDYSRFARRPGDQVMGQWVSIIGFGAIMPIFGCLAASSTQAIYGEALWNPPDLVQKWLDTDYNAKSRAAAFFAGFGLVVCQLAINTIDNAFSCGIDLAGLFPAFIDIRRGSYIGLVLSIAMCPWQLLSSAATFISVLSAYSVFLGPWVGIMVCDYWVLRRRCLKLSALYTPDKGSIYFYWHGINWRSYLAWAIGWSYLIPGFAQAVTPSVVVPEACTNLYYLAFPLGFVVSFLAHWAINTVFPPPGLREKDDIDVYGTFTPEEALRLGIAPAETYDGVAAEGSELEKEMGEPKIHSL
ncbi:hypothetical protein LTR17_002122 [Elasticomyces elasticus]|nr:hypothetical protein LTR17_002122 [Elasticomyces elasticus]